MLITQAVHDTEQLYNCLLLCTINSDVEGFNIIWDKLNNIHWYQNSCESVKKNISGTVLSKALRNIRLSCLDVAYFHCKRSATCVMFDHMCKVLCHDLWLQQLTDAITTITSSYHVDLRDTDHEQSCCYSYMHIINGYHGWRTGFTMETDKCQIPSLDIRQLSEEVLELFAGIKQPLVIKGVGSDWNLSTKWTRKYLQKHFGSVEVLVRE